MFKVPEQFRMKYGNMGTDKSYGNNGVFLVPINKGDIAQCIASDGEGWEHVSITLYQGKNMRQLVRCAYWNEMSFIKNKFWDENDCVVQFHPPKSDYVNNHPYCLHLWRPTTFEIPRPDPILVGIKSK